MSLLSAPARNILFRPARAWELARAAEEPWIGPLLRHVIPLAFLPALAWPVGQATAGRLPTEAVPLLAAFLATFLFSVLSVVFLAAALFAVSPFFDCPRQWNRSFAIAAYASTPVLLSGALLFIPLLIVASFAAMAYFLVLCDMGVKALLGCRENDAAAFVVTACVAAGIASGVLGALCSAAGAI